MCWATSSQPPTRKRTGRLFGIETTARYSHWALEFERPGAYQLACSARTQKSSERVVAVTDQHAGGAYP